MGWLFSAETNGFYQREIHGAAIPQDAVEVTDKEREQLLAGVAEGKTIVLKRKKPTLVDAESLSFEEAKKQKLIFLRKQTERAYTALRDAFCVSDSALLFARYHEYKIWNEGPESTAPICSLLADARGEKLKDYFHRFELVDLPVVRKFLEVQAEAEKLHEKILACKSARALAKITVSISPRETE